MREGTRNRAGEKAKGRGDGGKNSLKGCRRGRTGFIFLSLYPPRVPGWGLHIRQRQVNKRDPTGAHWHVHPTCTGEHPVGRNSRGG